MFYSQDILGKKSPLGAIWIAAHQPRKLNKQKTLSISVPEVCTRIMDPEVPQALRLQAILVGGVVLVFNKQSMILLEDAQEMLKRLRAMGTAEDAAKVTLEQGKRQAKVEAITLGVSDLGLAGPLDSLFPTFPAQLDAELLLPGMPGDPALGLGDELFAAPSLPDMGGMPSGAAAAAAGRRGRRQQGREGPVRNYNLLALEAGPEVDLDLHRHDLHLLDHPETFDVPDLGLGLPGADGLLLGDQMEPPVLMDAPLLDELVPVPSAPVGEPVDAAQQEQQEEQGSERRRSEQPPSEAAMAAGEVAEGQAAPHRGQEGSEGRMPRVPRQRKQKGLRPATVDALESLVIGGSTYRQWQQDTGDLVVARPRTAALRALAAGGAPLPQRPATASLMLGVGWPPELLAIFEKAAAPAGAAEATGCKRKGAKQGEAPQLGVDQAGQQELGGHVLDDAVAEMPFPPAEGFLYDDQLLPPVDAELRPHYGATEGEGAAGDRGFRGSGSERFGGEEDVETERLRAALNNPTDPDYFLQGLTPASLLAPGGSAGALAGSKRTASGLRRDSEGGLAGLLSEGRRSSADRLGAAGRLADLHEGLQYEGGEELLGMLPVVGEDEAFLEGVAAPAPGSRSAKRARLALRPSDAAPAGGLEGSAGATGGAGAGSGAGNGRAGTLGTLGTSAVSQFDLLEESNRQTQGLGALYAPQGVSRHTHALINVLRHRFHALESQAEEAPALSLLQLSERLNRREAAKLFSQFLVLCGSDYVRASQEAPYADIILTRGPFL